jgi:hypothetical protein
MRAHTPIVLAATWALSGLAWAEEPGAAEAPSAALLSLSTDTPAAPAATPAASAAAPAADCARCRGEDVDGEVDHGGYGAPMWGLSVLGGVAMPTEGGRGAFLIDHRWAVGGYGFHVRPAHDGQAAGEGPHGGHHGHGHHGGEGGRPREALSASGVFVERIFYPSATLHPSVELGVGRGHLSLGDQRAEVVHTSAAVRLELRAARWARLVAGARLDASVVPGSPSLLMMNGTGVGGDLMIKFGWF